MSRTAFRIFLSSTFGDFQVEREALKERVWPRLEHLCTTRNASFQVIDLRWGISPDTALSHETVSICLDEVARCQRLSPQPNFVMLLGDRYGWRPAPSTIPADEFAAVQKVHAETPSAMALLNRWYVRDSNATPAVYVLLPRDEQYADGALWTAVEAELLGVLRQAATALGITPERRELYFLSATHLEIVHGLLRSPTAQEHVFAFERRIANLPTTATEGRAHRFSDYTPIGTTDPDAAMLRQELQSEVAQVLPPEQVYHYSVRWQGAEDPVSTDHLEQLCTDVEASLRKVITRQLAEQTSSGDALSEELVGQEKFCHERAANIVGRGKELTAIVSYVKEALKSKRPVTPLIIHGPGGSGKSALLAKGIERLQQAYPETLLLYRFIGTTPRSWDVSSCLNDLLVQLSRALGKDTFEIENPTPGKLGEKLRELLEQAAQQQPVLMILDALDQFGSGVRLADILPRKLPRHVGLILSVLDGPQQQAVTNLYPSAKKITVPILKPTECKKLLAQLIAPRTLTSAQQQALLQPAQADGRPLYLTLLAPIARKLKSGDPVPTLPSTVEELVRFVLAEISSRHGEKLTCHALAYLRGARFGLSETELQELLWRDPEVRKEFERTKNPDQPNVQSLPPILWSRLYAELDPYLNEQWIDNNLLYRFFHRVVAEQIEPFTNPPQPPLDRGEDNLAHPLTKVGGGVHSLLADYFNDQPLYQDQTVNGRKVMELPWHLVQSQRIDEAKSIVTNFDFAIAKCRLNRSDDWADDFGRIKAASTTLDQERDWRIWESFVNSNRHILRRGDEDWPAHKILLQLAIEHADDSPATIGAEKFLAEGKCDWAWLRRERRVEKAGVDPCLAVMEGHTDRVKGAQALADGRILSWSNDNSLRLWDARSGECLATLKEHTRCVNGAQVLADGRILSWSDDNSLRLWDAHSGKCLATLVGHAREVEGVQILADGRILSWSLDDSLRLWDAHSGKCLATLVGHTDYVKGGQVLADGRILSWSVDHSLRLWDARNGKCLATFVGHTRCVNGAQVLADGRILSWSEDRSLRLWDPHSGECLATLVGHTNRVKGVQILADGRILSWSVDGSLRLWDPHSGECLAILVGHTNYVKGAQVLADGRILSWSGDHSLRLWDARSGECLATLEGHTYWVRGAQILADGRILSWSNDNSLRLWDARSGECLATLVGHTETVNGAQVLADGRILSWSEDRSLRLWDTHSGECLATLEGHTHLVRDAQILADGRILSWSGDGLRLWDPHSGECLAILVGHTNYVKGVQILADGGILSWSWDDSLRLWDARSGECLATLEGHTNTVDGVHVMADGRILSWSWDGSLRLWDARSGECLAILEGHTNYVKGAQVLADGRILSWSDDNSLRLWDAHSGKCLATLEGHTETVDGVHVMADGRILSWSLDDSLRLWDAHSGKCLATLEGHTNTVDGVHVMADGRILSWSWDGSLRLWDARSGECLATLVGHTNRVRGARILADGRILSWSRDHSLRLWDARSGECLAILVGHSHYLNGTQVLADGRILSWSCDSIRLWDNNGEITDVIRYENIFSSPKEVWQTVLGVNQSRSNLGLCTIDQEVHLFFRNQCSFRWHGISRCTAWHLFDDGRAVFTQDCNQFCVISTWRGNKRLTLPELEALT